MFQKNRKFFKGIELISKLEFQDLRSILSKSGIFPKLKGLNQWKLYNMTDILCYIYNKNIYVSITTMIILYKNIYLHVMTSLVQLP